MKRTLVSALTVLAVVGGLVAFKPAKNQTYCVNAATLPSVSSTASGTCNVFVENVQATTEQKFALGEPDVPRSICLSGIDCNAKQIELQP